MSHLLENHKGLCSNVHGHNYKMFVTVKKNGEDNSLSSKEMVVDFKDLKEAVNKIIVDTFDHSFCYNRNNRMSCIIADFLKKEINQKLMTFSMRTTAENMAEWIYNELNEYFSTVGIPVECVKIKLYETDTSYAEYVGDKK